MIDVTNAIAMDQILSEYGMTVHVSMDPIDVQAWGGHTAQMSGRSTVDIKINTEYFKKMISVLQTDLEEKKVRDENPAVANAWEQYQLLLGISK